MCARGTGVAQWLWLHRWNDMIRLQKPTWPRAAPDIDPGTGVLEQPNGPAMRVS
jgi:hypothetical protein